MLTLKIAVSHVSFFSNTWLLCGSDSVGVGVTASVKAFFDERPNYRMDASSDNDFSSKNGGDNDSGGTIELLTSTSTDENEDEKESDGPSTQVLDSTDATDDEPVTDCDEDDRRLELLSSAEKKRDGVDEDTRERQTLADIVMSRCCSEDCILQLTGHAILTTRRKHNNLSANERRQWLIDKIFDFSSVVNGKVEDTKFSISGTGVCRRAFSLIYKIPPRNIARAIKSVGQGNLVVEHGNKGRKKASVKHEGAKAWMEQYFSLIGDKMPNSKQIHLPSWDTQKNIYGRYKQDMAEQMIDESEVMSLSMFYKLWIDDFSHVVIPENNRFSKCDICVKLTMEKQGLHDKEKKKALQEARDTHMDLVKAERKKYHNHRQKSRDNHTKYITIIIDGMDQSKTNLPNCSILSKSSSSLWRLRTHITGTIIHTRAPHGKVAYGFIDCLQWPHGSNLTLTILLKSIYEYQNDYPLAENLYIQMDNTCRENKNRFVLSMCAVLVQLGIFQKVQINFLPVGHTHEDIDQLFSKISDEIKRIGCECIPDLISLIHGSSTPNPVTFLLDGVWDFKEWLKPHMAEIEQHSWYHVYKFTRNERGIAQMHYKHFSSQAWLPNEDGIQLPGEQLLMSCPDPSNAPSLLCPSPDKLDLDRLLRDLPKYQPWLKEISFDRWKLFMDEGPTQLSTVDPSVVWVLPVLQKAANDRPVSIASSSTVGKETQVLLDKETKTPNKIIVRPSKRKHGRGTTESYPGPAISCGEPIKNGNLVACYLDKYQDEEPQIARINKVKSETVEVQWMQGSYSDTWHPCKVKKGRNYEPWLEEIPRSAILYQIELTSAMRLAQPLRKKLKLSYGKL